MAAAFCVTTATVLWASAAVYVIGRHTHVQNAAAVETDHMSLHLPVQAQAFCDICKTEGTISLGSWELDDTSLAVVAELDELRRDGFTLRGGLIVCKGCLSEQ